MPKVLYKPYLDNGETVPLRKIGNLLLNGAFACLTLNKPSIRMGENHNFKSGF